MEVAVLDYQPLHSKAVDPALIFNILPFLASSKELWTYRLISKQWNEQIKKRFQIELKKIRRSIMKVRKHTDVELDEHQETLICLLSQTTKHIENPLFQLAIMKQNRLIDDPKIFLDSFLDLGTLVIKNKRWSPDGMIKWPTQAYSWYTDDRRASLLNMDFYLNIPRESLDFVESVFQAVPYHEGERLSMEIANLALWSRETLRFGKLALGLTSEAKAVLKEIVSQVSSNDVFEGLLKEFSCLVKVKTIWESAKTRQAYHRIDQLTLEKEKKIQEKDQEIKDLKITVDNLTQEINKMAKDLQKKTGKNVESDMLLRKAHFATIIPEKK